VRDQCASSAGDGGIMTPAAASFRLNPWTIEKNLEDLGIPHLKSEMPGFPARGAAQGRLCGFLDGKPKEVRQRHRSSQEIRGVRHPSGGGRERIKEATLSKQAAGKG
jgi:hypothetical protein